MEKPNSYGFTLIELLVTMAVASILLGIGIPSFADAVKNARVSADYNELTHALYLGRSEAIKTASPVSICPRSAVDAMTCGSSTAQWSNGWIVFYDNTSAAYAQFTTIDPEDEIISVHPEPKSDSSITARGSSDRTELTASERFYITYSSDGQSDWENGTFTLCDSEDALRSRALNVAPTGDVRPGRRSNSDYPRNIWGSEACDGP